MTGMPRFSIVSIAYNNLEGLKRTVASVDAQLFKDWQHIIVDGASSDGTHDWLSEIRGDPRRQWSSEPDRGIYDAMNKGLRQACGDLIIVLNSGDAFGGNDVLEQIDESQRRLGWLWAYGAVRFTDARGQVIGAYTFDPYDKSRFLMGFSWIPHASVVVSSRLAARLGDYAEELGTVADQEYLMRAAAIERPTVLTSFLVNYERGGVSQSGGARERELAWHHMRKRTGQLWRGSTIADRLAAELLALRAPTRRMLRKWGGPR